MYVVLWKVITYFDNHKQMEQDSYSI